MKKAARRARHGRCASGRRSAAREQGRRAQALRRAPPPPSSIASQRACRRAARSSSAVGSSRDPHDLVAQRRDERAAAAPGLRASALARGRSPRSRPPATARRGTRPGTGVEALHERLGQRVGSAPSALAQRRERDRASTAQRQRRDAPRATSAPSGATSSAWTAARSTRGVSGTVGVAQQRVAEAPQHEQRRQYCSRAIAGRRRPTLVDEARQTA